MKIAVCAKYVPEAAATRRIDPQTKPSTGRAKVR